MRKSFFLSDSETGILGPLLIARERTSFVELSIVSLMLNSIRLMVGLWEKGIGLAMTTA